MIFIGCNYRVGFPKYYNHHLIWTDSRILPLFVRWWWNRLKKKQPAWQIVEWVVAYRKPYCKKCIEMFIEDDRWVCFNGVEHPTKEDRIKIVKKLQRRFR